MSIRVLLADDHRILREGLKSLLRDEADIEVVGEAENGREAVRLARELRPDVTVMDLNMPEMSGVDATSEILASHSDANVLALSMVLDHACVVEALKAGAKGYLLKDCAAGELVEAIRAVAHGASYLSREVTALLVAELSRSGDRTEEPARSRLSEREREVLRLIAEGLSIKEIAFRFGVSTKTVEVQRANVMKKLNLFSIAELTKFAIREGLTDIG